MSNLTSFTIRVDKLPKEKFVQGKDGAVYLTLQSSTSDETNQFGQNVTIIEPQSKEERDAKKPKNYIGNGNVFWTDGKITTAEKKQEATKAEIASDLPF
jgi:hypothetical protein